MDGPAGHLDARVSGVHPCTEYEMGIAAFGGLWAGSRCVHRPRPTLSGGRPTGSAADGSVTDAVSNPVG
jgi:hypothetical protein